VTQWQWDPATYLDGMLDEIPGYAELQERTAAATRGEAAEILELGVGTGETARRVLALQPKARLTGIDSSREMLARAREVLPEADLRLARLEDPLPERPFDLVYSALVVHHLDSAGKRDLFARIADALRPGGRFVLADVVVPDNPDDAHIPIDWVMDVPDRLDDQLAWLRDAGFDAETLWASRDLALVRAERPKAAS
jgi:tRNA (cmo5U34)-methyltransferase